MLFAGGQRAQRLAAEVLGSQARAGGFWLRKRAVHHADRHPLLARASRHYLERTSPSWRLPSDPAPEITKVSPRT